MTLWAEFLTNQDRPVHKWTHYFPAYERHLGRYVNQPVTLLEIGCWGGGSLQLWKKYLGPYARIVGVDINEGCRSFEEPQIAVRIGDQADPAFLASLVEEFGPLDVVIDDGSHKSSDIRATFDALYPHTTGVYVVEDLQTAYAESYDGGLGRMGTFIEHSKNLIDELHADCTEGLLAPTAFTETTLSLHVYHGLVVFEKGRHVAKHAPMTWGETAVAETPEPVRGSRRVKSWLGRGH